MNVYYDMQLLHESTPKMHVQDVIARLSYCLIGGVLVSFVIVPLSSMLVSL